jgi:hypothetical protein
VATCLNELTDKGILVNDIHFQFNNNDIESLLSNMMDRDSSSTQLSSLNDSISLDAFTRMIALGERQKSVGTSSPDGYQLLNLLISLTDVSGFIFSCFFSYF